ncbi:hypothetical protein VWO27_09825, partial [Campylobacter coli]|nr:hypothetical protein [Campylobacter coli]
MFFKAFELALHFFDLKNNNARLYYQKGERNMPFLSFLEKLQNFCDELAKIIAEFNIEFDSICSPALGGILAGYELARACDKRFI